MAEVVDIQTIKMHRKSSEKGKAGLWTINESDTGTIPRLPPIHRSAETTPTGSHGSTYKRSRKKITISFIKKKSDVNANEVEEEKHVHKAKNQMSHSQDYSEGDETSPNEEINNSENVHPPSECNKEDLEKAINAVQDENKDSENDDDRTSKTSSYSINYPSYSRESSTVTIPFDCGSIEGILFPFKHLLDERSSTVENYINETASSDSIFIKVSRISWGPVENCVNNANFIQSY